MDELLNITLQHWIEIQISHKLSIISLFFINIEVSKPLK